MALNFIQISWLAFIQGLTEFLPISSSAHLILPSLLLDWPDQGLTFDVAVHLGSLAAVIFYFRRDIAGIVTAWLLHLFRGRPSGEAKLGWLLIIATVPAGLAGLLVNDFVANYARALPVIASASIIFAVLLLYSQRKSSSTLSLDSLTWRQAAVIGVAQTIALIPGASRSGVTMTAALLCNMSKSDAGKFSFLLSIPIILASGLLKGLELSSDLDGSIAWFELGYGAIVSGVVALFCIHCFLAFIERIGFLPFVIYRIVLGVSLLFLYFS
ncbi:MAG: undecaprenyl-diphosphatase [Pseudohongiellaceae bacterium]